MATNTANILVGAGVLSIGDYVAAAGAGSLTDVGHAKEPIVMSAGYTDFDIISERAFGVLRKVPQDAAIAIRVPMLETTPEHMRIATRQPAANLTGSPPDLTLRVGALAEQYHQIEIVGPGQGTGSVRTLTFWRCIVMELAEVPIAKGDSQVFNVTFAVLFDDSVATADKFFKSVDS